MKNFLFKIKYDGSAFHGFQMQKDDYTVQGALTKAFEEIFNTVVTINGCSRTDTGVHANEFCFSVKLETDMCTQRIIYAVNSKLPPQCKIFDCREMPDAFHARFDCKGKEYVYKIYNGKYPNPFYENRALFHPYELNEKNLSLEARSFIGTHDFSAFCASACTAESHIRTVFDARVERNGEEVLFYVSADGFLYNMVRIMTGTLLDISRGKIKENSIPDIIQSRSRNNAGITVKPYGLYLNKVYYLGEEYEKK